MFRQLKQKAAKPDPKKELEEQLLKKDQEIAELKALLKVMTEAASTAGTTLKEATKTGPYESVLKAFQNQQLSELAKLPLAVQLGDPKAAEIFKKHFKQPMSDVDRPAIRAGYLLLHRLQTMNKILLRSVTVGDIDAKMVAEQAERDLKIALKE